MLLLWNEACRLIGGNNGNSSCHCVISKTEPAPHTACNNKSGTYQCQVVKFILPMVLLIFLLNNSQHAEQCDRLARKVVSIKR